MSDHYEGYRHGKADAYALAALIVRKVNDIEDAAELLQALAKVADEKNVCQQLKTEQDGIES